MALAILAREGGAGTFAALLDAAERAGRQCLENGAVNGTKNRPKP
jgi:hypothetical protein